MSDFFNLINAYQWILNIIKWINNGHFPESTNPGGVRCNVHQCPASGIVAAGRCPFVFQSCAWPGRTALSSTATTQPLGMWTETYFWTRHLMHLWPLKTLGTVGTLALMFEDVGNHDRTSMGSLRITSWPPSLRSAWGAWVSGIWWPSCEAPLKHFPWITVYYSQSSQAPQMKTWSGLWWAYVYIYIYNIYIYTYSCWGRVEKN